MISAGRPQKITCPLGNIQYFHMQEKLFFGFDTRRMAYAEKAFCDLIYLRGLRGRSDILSEEIYLDRFNEKKLFKFAKHFPSWVSHLIIAFCNLKI